MSGGSLVVDPRGDGLPAFVGVREAEGLGGAAAAEGGVNADLD